MSVCLNKMVKALLAITTCIALVCLIGYGCRSFEREKQFRRDREVIEWIESLGGKIEARYTPGTNLFVGYIIDLSNTNVQDNELYRLNKLLPKIQDLNLSQTCIDGSGMPNLINNCTIGRLSLHHTMITNESLCRFIDGVEIYCLDLSDTPITDESVKCLLTMKNDVGCLDISSTRITISGISRLKEISYLRELNLRNMSLKDEDVPILMDLLRKEPKLWSLDLRGTKLSHSAVAQLQNELRKKYINTEIIFGEQPKDIPRTDGDVLNGPEGRLGPEGTSVKK